jgi:hypothetical protein
MLKSADYPSTALVLSLVGAIFIAIAGIQVRNLSPAFTVFLGGLGANAGFLGIIWAAIIILSAYCLRLKPSQHIVWGIAILVFSLISWWGTAGGFFIGLLLAFIGGVFAIVWSPPKSQSAHAPIAEGKSQT